MPKALEGTGQAATPRLVRGALPADAIEIDVAGAAEKLQRPNALGVQLVHKNAREFVRVDHHQKGSIFPAPKLFAHAGERLRNTERPERERPSQKGLERLGITE